MRRRPTALRLVRVASGIPLYEVALASGIDPPRLSRIERGLVAGREEEIARILKALGPAASASMGAALRFLHSLERVES